MPGGQIALVRAPSSADREVGTGRHGCQVGLVLTSEVQEFGACPHGGEVVVEEIPQRVMAVSAEQVTVGDIAVWIDDEEIPDAIAVQFAASVTVRERLFDVRKLPDGDRLVTVLEPAVIEIREERSHRRGRRVGGRPGQP